MTLSAGELFAGPTTRGPGLRFQAKDIRVKKFAAVSGAPILAQLTPVSWDSATDNWKVWSADVNEAQTLTFDATGGVYTLVFDGESTPSLTYLNTTGDTAVILAALEALSNINPGDVTVTRGTPSGNVTIFTVTFTGQYAGTNVPVMTNTETLTGGGATLANGTTTAGVDDTTSAIDGFVADFDGIQTHATLEVLGNVIMEGVIDYRDIPLPSGESQPVLLAALKAGMRAKGFIIDQLAGSH